MRQFVLTLSFIFCSGLMFTAWAVNAPGTSSPVTQEAITLKPQILVKDFISIDLKQMRSADGKKLKWNQRIALDAYQKNLARKVKQGKIDAASPLFGPDKQPSGQKYGLLSIIFSVLGIAFLFVPNALVLIGLGCSIAGFIMGIIGLKKDAEPLLSVIGVILGGLVILLYLVAVIAIGSVF